VEDRPLSVGVVLPSASRRAGGLFTAVLGLAHGLVGLGHAVTVYAPRDADAERDLDDWLPLVPRLFEMRGPAALGYAPGLAAAVEAGGHDVLHQHGLWQHPSIVSERWARRTGRPVVVSPHGMLDPWALRNAGWKKKVAGLLYEDRNLGSAACLHALNEAEAEAIATHCRPASLAVVPNGIVPCPPEWAARPLAGGGQKTLLFLGRIHPKKGLSELLDAWAALADARRASVADWRLVIAGWDDGGHLAGLEQQVAARGLAGRVRFAGPLFGDVKRAALAGADAFVLPSRSEGLPMSVLEAWAAGLPVLMTAECNLPEGFAAGAAVELPLEAAAMADVLERALGDPGLARFGEAGRALVDARFRWSRVAEAHAGVYRWLIDGGEPPSAVRSQRTGTRSVASHREREMVR
jgi:glycosyltransferase involved in cell wall biosynthesis